MTSATPVLTPTAVSPMPEAAARERHFWPAVWALGVGSFAIGTGEFVIMGLLPEVAKDLGVTIPQAGHVITAYALGVVVGAPVLAVLAAHWRRRALLIALMALFALGNFASAMAPGYVTMNLLRLLTGLPHGTYFGVAALMAASLAPPNRRASAVGLVMSGLTLATLAGVPLAAWLGQHLWWRSAFVLVGAIAALACVLVRHGVPDDPAPQGASPLRELGALAHAQVWLTLGIAAIGFGGMFAVFSYVKPLLTEVTGLSVDAVPLVLALFGVGTVVGNLVGARLADKALMPTIGGLLAWSVLVLAAIPFTAPYTVAICINVFLLGTIVAIGPALQIRLMDTAGHAQTLAAALNHSAFNTANALGAWLGGVAIAGGLGWTSTGWVGVLLAFGGLAVFGASLVLRRRMQARGEAHA
jgi:MFS transporter, DHA1 family, inner membrane transport protein